MRNDIELVFKMKALEKKTNMKQVAERAGMKPQTIYVNIFKGNPTIDSLERVAEALECDLEIKLIDREK